jgi:cytidine deaminase
MKMTVDDHLVQTAIDFVQSRFPESGWAGAAAMYVEGGQILVSTAPDSPNPSAQLCHEAGAICEAFKLNKRVIATVCVSRDPAGRFWFLAPCGICQERLMLWGPDIEAAVADESNSEKWAVKTLRELQPYHWHRQFEK